MPHKSEEEKQKLDLIEKIRAEIDNFFKLKRGFSEERLELIDLHITLGYLYADLPRFQVHALQEFLIALSLTEELGDKEKLAHIYGIIASLYLARLNYLEAISYYTKSLEFLQMNAFSKEAMINKKGLGVAYLKSDNSEKGITILLEAAEICVEIGDINNYMEIMTLLSAYYQENEEWEMVLEVERKALKILLNIGADEEISRTHVDLGLTLNKLQRHTESLSHFKQAVNYAIKSENNLIIYQGIILVAETFFHLRDIASAKKEYLQALSMAVFMEMTEEIKKTKLILVTLGATEEEIFHALDTGKKEIPKKSQ